MNTDAHDIQDKTILNIQHICVKQNLTIL